MNITYVLRKIEENGKFEASEDFLLKLTRATTKMTMKRELTSLGVKNGFRVTVSRIENHILYKFKKVI